LTSGVAGTEAEAAKRFDENDWPNGIYLVENSNINEAHRWIHSVQDNEITK